MRKFWQTFWQSHDSAIALVLFLLVFAALQIAQKPFWDSHITGGDEPIYLAIAHSITYDHSLNMQKFLADKQWQTTKYEKAFDTSLKEWVLTPPAPQAKQGAEFSVHNFGYPLVIALPYYFFGRLGVVILMEIIGALIAVNIYYLCRRTGASNKLSFFVSLAMALTLPLAIYSFLSFSDLLAALLISYAFRFENSWLSLAAIAYLPFIKVKYIFQAIIFAALYWVNNKQKKLIVPIVGIGLILLCLSFKFMYGSFSPFVIKDATGGFGNITGLSGLLVDWRVGLISHAPYYLFVFPGLFYFWLKNKKMFWQWLAIVAPYYLMVGLYGAWCGDHAPPSRHLVAIIPLFALPIVALLDRGNKITRRILQSVFAILVGLSVVMAYYGVTHPGSLYMDTKDNIGFILDKIGVHNNIEQWMPIAGNYNSLMILWIFALIFITILPIVINLWRRTAHGN